MPATHIPSRRPPDRAKPSTRKAAPSVLAKAKRAVKPATPAKAGRAAKKPHPTPRAADTAALRRLVAADPEIARAVRSLEVAGLLSRGPRRQVSTRVDPAILKAAGERFGLRDTSDVINAALAVAAAPDPFKAWLRDPGATLPDDFELAV